MTTIEKFAAWAWDNLPGGVPVQLWIWERSPWLAGWFELLANRRDWEKMMRIREVEIDTEPFRTSLAEAHAAIERVRQERGIDRFHDSGAASGALSEDEERERSEWPR